MTRTDDTLRARGLIGRLRITARAIWINISAGRRVTAGAGSFLRWLIDTFLYRVLGFVSFGGRRLRTIRFREGGNVTYRLNRGDFRAVAETWMTRAYELPFPIERPKLIVDLGANIGVTATWLALRYGCDHLIAVEPVPDNAALARRNLAANRIPAAVHEGVVGAPGATAHFSESEASTEGRVAEQGRVVRVLSLGEIIGQEPVDLMKMDIEGAEEGLLVPPPAWLDQVRLIVAELHPQFADVNAVVRSLEAAGFEYRRLETDHFGPKGSEFTAIFIRPEPG